MLSVILSFIECDKHYVHPAFTNNEPGVANILSSQIFLPALHLAVYCLRRSSSYSNILTACRYNLQKQQQQLQGKVGLLMEGVKNGAPHPLTR